MGNGLKTEHSCKCSAKRCKGCCSGISGRNGTRTGNSGAVAHNEDGEEENSCFKCSVHITRTVSDVESKERIRRMLMDDMKESFAIDVPTSGIVPILLFFGTKTETEIGELGVDRLRIDGFENVKKRRVVSVDMEVEGNGETDERQEMIPEVLQDERYLLFLRRTVPVVGKNLESAAKYLKDQQRMLLERARNNSAEIPLLTNNSSVAPKNIIEGIPGIRSCELAEETEKIFKSLVLKYGNDFEKYSESIQGIGIEECILKYYLMKNKTFSYIKRKSGRMSDAEIKLVVESEWNSTEIELFVRNFGIFGKNWPMYQALIAKSERDLKLFFRYYTKFVLPQRKEKTSGEKRKGMPGNEILEKWTIDERQVFAIYFPYYNKNWTSMATYFPSKTSGDLYQYYSKYFKRLSYNEQRLEASLHDFGRQLNTPPASYNWSGRREDLVHCSVAGILFKSGIV